MFNRSITIWIWILIVVKSLQMKTSAFNFLFKTLPGGSDSKESACNVGDQVWPLVRKIPWRREWLPTSVLIPGEFRGQSSLVGYSPWVTKSRSDFHFSLQLSQVRIFSFQSQAFFLALLILHLLGKFSCWCDWEEVIRLGKYKVLAALVLQKEVSLKCSHMWFGLRIINTPTVLHVSWIRNLYALPVHVEPAWCLTTAVSLCVGTCSVTSVVSDSLQSYGL